MRAPKRNVDTVFLDLGYVDKTAMTSTCKRNTSKIGEKLEPVDSV